MHATQQQSQTQRPRHGGCLKCGETGHWARDCQAPRDKWLPRDAAAANAGGSLPDQPPAGAEANNENAPTPQGAAAAAKEKHKRPKVTFELLKRSNGLPEVYHNFPDTFKDQFRGRGHEVSDLRRLLEMYKRWQGRIHPHDSFDLFITNVEKLSSSMIVQKEIQDMRMDLVQAAEEAMRPPVVAADAVDDDEQAQEGPASGTDLDLDEELLELAAGGGGAGEQPDMADDEELLALAMGGGGAEEAAANEPNAVDDEELLALAMEESQKEEVAAPPILPATQALVDDEELLELAMQE